MDNAQLINLIFMVAIFGTMYFFFIRPTAQKQKEQNKFIEELKVGQRLVTNSGIIGSIVKIEGEIITLDIGSKTQVKMLKSSLSKELSDKLSA